MFHTFSRSSAQDLRNALRERGPGATDCEPPSNAEKARLDTEDEESEAPPSAWA